jgi:putative ABC transport system permease protein
MARAPPYAAPVDHRSSSDHLAPRRSPAGHTLRARGIRKEPGFAVVAVATLALGIGTASAIFSVVHALLINPLPYPDSDPLVSIVYTVDRREDAYFGDQIYTIHSDQNRTFEAFGVWSPYAGAATVTGQGDPEEVSVLALRHGLLPALGVRPAIGLAFSVANDTPWMPDTVILTNGYWRRTFGGNPDVVRRVLTINSRPHQVIGVMPAEFRFGGAVVNAGMRASSPDVILPLQINRAAPMPVWRHLGVARLRPALQWRRPMPMSVAWSRSGRRLPSERNGVLHFARRGTASLRPLKQDVVGNVGRMLWVLMGT